MIVTYIYDFSFLNDCFLNFLAFQVSEENEGQEGCTIESSSLPDQLIKRTENSSEFNPSPDQLIKSTENNSFEVTGSKVSDFIA